MVVSKPESFSLPREVVADRARRIGKPGHVVEMGPALSPAHAAAGIRDCERAVSEEESEAETGACEAQVRLWDRKQLGAPLHRCWISSVETLVSRVRAVAIGVLAVELAVEMRILIASEVLFFCCPCYCGRAISICYLSRARGVGLAPMKPPLDRTHSSPCI